MLTTFICLVALFHFSHCSFSDSAASIYFNPNVTVSIVLENAQNATLKEYNVDAVDYYVIDPDYFPLVHQQSCTGAISLTKQTFRQGLGVAYEVYCKGNTDNLCVCLESGECFSQWRGLSEASLSPSCQNGVKHEPAEGAECHFYFYPSNGTSLGDKGTLVEFYDSDTFSGLSPDSPYLKTAAVSCRGCANIKNLKC